MVDVAQLVRVLDCGSRGRRFEPGLPPNKKNRQAKAWRFFLWPRWTLADIRAIKKRHDCEAIRRFILLRYSLSGSGGHVSGRVTRSSTQQKEPPCVCLAVFLF